MKRTAAVVVAIAIIAVALGCFHRYPPRIALEPLGTIGILQFRSETKGEIAKYTTQVFIEVLLKSQPGARIKDLGRADEVLRDIDGNRLSPPALKALRQEFGVDAVIFGTLDVSNIRPEDLGSIISSPSVSAEVDAVLAVRLVDARDGTTIWTGSARDHRTVAQVSVFRSGDIFFDARDPELAYGYLIRALVKQTTRDFRWR